MFICGIGPSEESTLVASVDDCSCTTCCEGTGQFLCAVFLEGICYCNLHCRNSADYVCCNNVSICDSVTIVPTLPSALQLQGLSHRDGKW